MLYFTAALSVAIVFFASLFGSFDGIVDQVTNTVSTTVDQTQNTINTLEQNAVETINQTIDTTTQQVLAPQASIFISPLGSVLKDTAHVGVRVLGALSVELYVRPTNSLISHYIGRANRVSDSEWKFQWETISTPNGSYGLYTVVTNTFGKYESSKMSISIQNPISITPQETITVNQIQTIINATEQNAIETLNRTTDTAIQNIGSELKNLFNSVKPDISSKNIPIANSAIDTSNAQTKIDLERLRREQEIRREKIRNEIRQNVERTGSAIIINVPERIRAEAERKKHEVIERAERVVIEYEKKIAVEQKQKRDQLSEYIFRDSDKDGVSDYDEVMVYRSNPLVADSDGDGFNDGLEIRVGSNSLDPTAEDKIVHEEPKEKGVVDTKNFKIESIAIVETEKTLEGKELIKKIEIKGTALPNSFVTLYIYSSTPIIVTVKTNSEGVWTYQLDKELSDGTHEVYIATTDTTGKIAAKSEPLPFIKTASAIVIGADLNEAVAKLRKEEAAPSFFKPTSVFFALSVIILMIGIAMMIIGYSSGKNPNNPIA